MQRNGSAERVADRLMVLTLSLGDAIQRNDRHEITALLQECQACVERLEQMKLDERAANVVRRVLHESAKLKDRLSEERVAAMVQLSRLSGDRHKVRGYLKTPTDASLERLG